MKYIVKSPLASKTMDFPKNKSYIFAAERLTYIIMEQKKIEHITLHLIVFGTIVIIGVLARQTVLHYGGTSSAATLFLWYAPLSLEQSILICKWYSDNSFHRQ